jgi:hypothetical protein
MATKTTKPHPLKEPTAYEAWYRSLSPAEQDRENQAKYRCTEYILSLLDEYEDSLGIYDVYPTKQAAMNAMNNLDWDNDQRVGPAAVWAEIEKCVTVYRGGDGDTVNEGYETIVRTKRP